VKLVWPNVDADKMVVQVVPSSERSRRMETFPLSQLTVTVQDGGLTVQSHVPGWGFSVITGSVVVVVVLVEVEVVVGRMVVDVEDVEVVVDVLVEVVVDEVVVRVEVDVDEVDVVVEEMTGHLPVITEVGNAQEVRPTSHWAMRRASPILQ